MHRPAEKNEKEKENVHKSIDKILLGIIVITITTRLSGVEVVNFSFSTTAQRLENFGEIGTGFGVEGEWDLKRRTGERGNLIFKCQPPPEMA